MQNKIIPFPLTPAFRAPSEEEVRTAVLTAAEKAGSELTQSFFNDYKNSSASLIQAA
jgi:hypothetical protein